MSFITELGKVASKAWTYFTEDPTGTAISNTAILGFTLNKLSKSSSKQSDPQTTANDKPNLYRVQLDPDTSSKIPIVYGTAYVGGKIIDAQLGADRCKTMWFCLALSEQTGNLIDTTASELTVRECWWNGNKLSFQSDGITVSRAVNTDGEANNDVAGKIRVYPFSGSSVLPTNIGSLGSGNTQNAYDLFPNWTTSHAMNDLVFVLISMDYDPMANIRGLGTWQFKVTNTMNKPGDVLYDYMTNTRYGAGIPPGEIDV